MSIESDTSFEIGVPSIDIQHKGFFNMVDEYSQKDESLMTFDEKKELIERLETYMESHFISEESLMAFIKFDKLKEHVEQHLVFSNRVAEYKLQLMSDAPEFFPQLLLFMKKWLVGHIANHDSKIGEAYSVYLAQKKG